MSAVKTVNPNADVIGKRHALRTNITAAQGLASLIGGSLGPRGSLRMLVSGAGDVKLTKDGKVLLDEMSLQHATASLVARSATAQDDITGDGTISTVLFVGELLKQAERAISEGCHPRIIADGFSLSAERVASFLESFKVNLRDEAALAADAKEAPEGETDEDEQKRLIASQWTPDREVLIQVARTSLRTKVHEELADKLTEIVVDSVLTVRRPGQPIDLHMVEIMHMKRGSALDTRFVDGLVLDHGARHPDMARRSEKAFILTCNVSLEYEKSEVNAKFFWTDAEERKRLVDAERKHTNDRVERIIALKKQVCDGTDRSFVVVNQKGIDPISLDLFQKNGIVGIRRAKRRNMERLSLACGGYAVNSVDDLEAACLGEADLVYEHTLGDDKFTFIEGCRNATSCTVLVCGPDDHTIRQIKDAIRDGLRAVLNVLEDGALVPGAGCFELQAYADLRAFEKEVQGKQKLGVRAFADALLCIPKTLADNAGHDAVEAVIHLLSQTQKGQRVGIDLETGKDMLPEKVGVWDNYRVKKQYLHLGSMIATKLLLVDEIMRAGRKLGKD